MDQRPDSSREWRFSLVGKILSNTIMDLNSEEGCPDKLAPIGPAPVSENQAADRLLVEAFYNAFNQHDPRLFDTVLSEGWEDIPLAPNQEPGPKGLKLILRELIVAFPDLALGIEEIIVVPRKAAARVLLTGTHRGSLFSIPATNKVVRMVLHEFHELDGGRIVRTWHLEDWFSLFLQIGQFPAPQP